MKPETRNSVLQELVPLGLRRTVGVPTLRFGRPATVVATGGRTTAGAAPREPLQWIVIDAASGDLSVVAHCAITTPLPGWTAPAESEWPAAPDGPVAGSELWLRVRDAFLAGEDVPKEDRTRAEEALLQAVQADLQDWLFECCSDFMDWLAA